MSTPKDDEYWFGQAGTMVSGAIGKLETTAAELKNLVIWIWGIFTTASIGTTVVIQLDWWWWIVFSLPYLLLIISYVTASNALFPENITFDYRAPQEIKGAYASALKNKKAKLSKARWLITFAAGYVSVMLIASFIFTRYYSPRSDSFSGILVKRKTETTLFVAGNIVKEKPATLFLESFVNKEKKPIRCDTVFLFTVKDGYFSTSINVDPTTTIVVATIEWQEGDVRKMLSKEIKK